MAPIPHDKDMGIGENYHWGQKVYCSGWKENKIKMVCKSSPGQFNSTSAFLYCCLLTIGEHFQWYISHHYMYISWKWTIAVLYSKARKPWSKASPKLQPSQQLRGVKKWRATIVDDKLTKLWICFSRAHFSKKQNTLSKIHFGIWYQKVHERSLTIPIHWQCGNLKVSPKLTRVGARYAYTHLDWK